jgi:hypothetical protein
MGGMGRTPVRTILSGKVGNMRKRLQNFLQIIQARIEDGKNCKNSYRNISSGLGEPLWLSGKVVKMGK